MIETILVFLPLIGSAIAGVIVFASIGADKHRKHTLELAAQVARDPKEAVELRDVEVGKGI